MCIPEKVECQQLTKQNDSLMWTEPESNITCYSKVESSSQTREQTPYSTMVLFFFPEKRSYLYHYHYQECCLLERLNNCLLYRKYALAQSYL